MQISQQAIERVIDDVWAEAMAKIVKGGSGQVRPMLGDDIDLFVPQVATAMLMHANPAFASVLYSSAYTSAKRNAYIIIRRLGMPPDFFWQFDSWTHNRAFDTLGKVIARVFASLMNKQKVGLLELKSLDMERGHFEFAFGDCAECCGLKSGNPLCFFHAGIFAGILGALLDLELDAWETQCVAQDQGVCAFKIGKRGDRETKNSLDKWLSRPSVNFDLSTRLTDSLDHRDVRKLGNLVDITYYQLLLSSCFLTNLGVLEQACYTSGEDLGRRLAEFLPQRDQGDAFGIITKFYRDLRHTHLTISEQGDAVEVQLAEAPEAHGPLAEAMVIPFLSGEIEGLLSALTHRPLRRQSSRHDGEKLLLLFSPKV